MREEREKNTMGEVRKRFIALVDILGFRELIHRRPDLTRFQEDYSRVFEPLAEEVDQLGVEHYLFSDSLFVGIRNQPAEQEFRNLVTFCSSLIRRSILSRLPIRGAISFGRVLWREGPREGTIVGLPIVEAYEFERLQDWIGVVLAPSAARYLAQRQNLELETKDQLTRYPVPMKQAGAELDAWAVKIPEEEDMESFLSLLSLESGNLQAQLKYKHTIKFLRYCREQRQREQTNQ